MPSTRTRRGGLGAFWIVCIWLPLVSQQLAYNIQPVSQDSSIALAHPTGFAHCDLSHHCIRLDLPFSSIGCIEGESRTNCNKSDSWVEPSLVWGARDIAVRCSRLKRYCWQLLSPRATSDLVRSCSRLLYYAFAAKISWSLCVRCILVVVPAVLSLVPVEHFMQLLSPSVILLAAALASCDIAGSCSRFE